jgi:hypothetical protein
MLKYGYIHLNIRHLHIYISGSPSGAAEDAVLLGCAAMSQRIVVSSSSGQAVQHSEDGGNIVL